MHSIRSGGSSRPSTSWISRSASLRVVRSDALRVRCSTSDCSAFCLTVSSSAFFSPRSGTRSVTRPPPRRSRSHSSMAA